MTRVQIVVLTVSALVIGASVAVGFGALKDDDDETAASAAGSTTPRTTSRPRLTAPRAINRVPKIGTIPCMNLKLSKAERASLEEHVFKREAIQGSVYFGTCNGSVWSMARFDGGGDGVYRNVRSSESSRLGSIVEAKCDVPDKLLKLWRQYDGCAPQPVASDPAPEPQPEPEPEPTPAPQPPAGSDSGMNRRLPNGRTWYQQWLHCRIMRQANPRIPCYVPPL